MATQLVPGNNAISIDESGWVLFKRPHGTFYSTSTQAIANVNNAQAITYNNSADVDGLKFAATDSKIYVPTAGSYEIIFSGIADLASGAVNKILQAWIAVDGSAVTDSNTIVRLPALTTEIVVAVSWILDLTPGQYIEVITWGDATACQWLATAAGINPTRPSCPSVITTVKKISSRLSYE